MQGSREMSGISLYRSIGELELCATTAMLQSLIHKDITFRRSCSRQNNFPESFPQIGVCNTTLQPDSLVGANS